MVILTQDVEIDVAKAFVWLDKTKIRKGNPIHAAIGLRYFLLQFKDWDLLLAGGWSMGMTIENTGLG